MRISDWTSGVCSSDLTYHVRRSSDIIVRLGDGTAESHARMQDAVDDAWRFVGELFVDDEIGLDLAQRKIIPAHASLWTDWLSHVKATLDEATLTMPDPDQANHLAYRGGMHGRHTEALGYILAEMQHLQRAYPGASWRSEEHTSELQSLMRISYAVFCLKK